MTYESLVKKLASSYKGADASSVNEHVALQFNIFGEGEGALYLEIADGKVNVQPYEYYDRDAIVTCDAKAFSSFASGKLNLIEGNETGKVRVEGNLDKVAMVALVKKAEVKKAPAKKAPAKKAEVKVEAEKKAPAKKTVAKAETAKTAEKKAPAKSAEKKPAAKKTTKK